MLTVLSGKLRNSIPFSAFNFTHPRNREGIIFQFWFGLQVVTELAQGDQVWVRMDGGTSVRGGPYTIFTGYLVEAE